ncbi:MAG: neutral zinc metallopeptidase [Propionicimonas sp.]|uniref:neutral zinc metallopeptidase n=1 Tax=Propionicimonas sp. TaxID=1955623 RepID=UPI002B21AAA3|nr:neutral zinc metallopeptidase [Propionicimonas sp.]MEA4945079.1 neutral zinc metallopeptidase [Propionicimonas sp.]
MTQQPWGQSGAQRPGSYQGGPGWPQQPGQAQGWQQPYGQQPGWGHGQAPWPAQAPTQYQGQWPGQYPGRAPVQQYPGAPSQPPRKQGSPLKLLLLGLVAVVALGFFFISLKHYLDGGQDVVTPQPGSTLPPAVAPEDIPEPDYNPSDLPMPTTYAEAEQWLTDNPVYAQSVAVPTNCALTRVDAVNASVSELEDHLNNLTGCLWVVWSPPLEAAGFEMPRPPVTVYNQPITTGCGQLEDVNAVYCAGDQRVYYAKPLYKIFPADVARLPFMPDMVIGHEFGHAIQARTGILISDLALEQKMDEDEATVMSRRAEQQADCFAGQFLQAVSQATGMSQDNLTNLKLIAANLGDDVLTGQPGYVGDHGSSAARERWFTKGLTETSMGQCNTWTVPAGQVR